MKFLKVILYNIWKLYVALIFLITLLLFYPILFLILRIKESNKYSFPLQVLWSRLIRILCFYPVSISGELPKRGSTFIIVGNHTSYLDIFLLYSILPHHRFLFLGKSELLKYPLIKTFFKRLNIPVDRSSKVKSARSFIRAKKAISQGWNIVIFPEGGIFEDAPKLHPFKEGAFQLAKSVECAILPITFKNHYRLLSDPEIFSAPAMPGISKIHFHPIISKQTVGEKSSEELTNIAFRYIQSEITKK